MDRASKKTEIFAYILKRTLLRLRDSEAIYSKTYKVTEGKMLVSLPRASAVFVCLSQLLYVEVFYGFFNGG